MKKQLLKSKSFFAFALVLFSLTSNAQTLRQIAESKGKYIGNLMSDGLIANNSLNNNAPRNILKDNFNMLVTENAMKMESILPNRPANPFNIQLSELNLVNVNNFVAFANLYSMRKRGHTMLWHSQAPAWLLNDAKNWTAQQIRDFMKSYIKILGAYCRGKINEWDVANEMLDDGSNYNYRTEAWYSNIGDKTNQSAYNTAVFNLIKDCFIWAREADPEAELFYNDYGIENRSWTKAIAAEILCRNLMIQGAPIDGVGFQSHFQTTNLTDGTVNGMVLNIREYAKSNLNVHITELDVRQNGAAINGTQAHDGYWNLVRSCFLEPNCTGILVWGIRDSDSWIPYAFGSGVAPYLLYNDSYAQNGSYNAQGVITKGAWTGFRDGVAGLADATFPAASLVGDGNPGTGVNIGSETYTIRARGIVGGEQIQLQINGVVKATFTLTTALQNYAVSTNTGTARVVYINDEGTRDVVVDYLKVGNTIIQSENQVINTGFYSGGRCGGGSNNETMHCNGYIEYAGSDGYKTYTVRARGTTGGEQIQLQINGIVKTTFTLITTFHDYKISTNAGTVRVVFINDEGAKDVIIDYIKVGNTTIQSENQAINTGFYANGSCGGGSNNETMHCNGYIEYAGSAASTRVNSEESEFINEEPIISISPNPAENTINMVVGAEFIGGEFYIIDQMGLSKLKTLIPNAEFQVNISPLKTGVYITKAVSEGGKIGTKKLIIK